MKSNILAEPILVGREYELEELQAALNSAINGKGIVVFVSGEAGAGKTRLLTEFLNRAKLQGVTILTGWCLSNAAVPYFPFFEAFNKYFSTEQSGEIEIKSWLQGPVLGTTQTVTPQVWKDQTFTAVANTLSHISSKQPVILFIDDLHWADSASIALIHYLARAIVTEKVLVVGTFRVEQLPADAEGKPHPLVETLRMMRREDSVKELAVSSLSRAGVSELAANMLGGDLQQDLAQKLSDESQGNPLFIVESLRMLNEQKGITFEGDRWGLTSNAIGIPPKIKDIVLQRLDVLSRSQRNILEAASVIGEKFDAGLFASVLGQDPVEVIKALEAIAKDTSLIRCEGEWFRFDHARTRDAIYDDASPAIRKVYHAKVADTLERNGTLANLPLNDLAYQYACAGNREKSVKYALAAGQDALAKWSNAEATRQFKFVLQAIGENPQFFQEKLTALEGLGDAYYANNSFQQAIANYEQVIDLQVDDTAKLRCIRKGWQAATYQADFAKEKAFSRRAEGIAVADRLEAARIRRVTEFVVEKPSDWLAAFKMLNDIIRIFDEEYALADSAYSLHWFGFGQAMTGKLESGVASALRSVALYEELGDYRSELEALAYTGGTFQGCGLIEESFRMFARAVDVNERYKIWDYIRLFPAFVWESMGLLGVDVPAAISKAKKALEYFEKTDSYLYAAPVNGVLVVGYSFAGDMAHADEYFGKLMSLPKHILSNGPAQLFLAPTMGVYYAAKGDFEKSEKIFTDWLVALSSSFPSPFLEAASRQFYAWTLNKQGKMDEAKAQVEQAQRLIAAAQMRFSHVRIEPSMMTLTSPEAERNFFLRLDIINVSKSQGTLVNVEGMPPQLEIVETSPNCTVREGRIEFKDKGIGAFETKTVKLTVRAASLSPKNSFELNPTVTYIDDLGETKICSPRPFTISVQKTRQEKLPRTSDPVSLGVVSKPFDIFLCYKKSSGKDFADHLKTGLEELGLHTFLDSKDIPQVITGGEEWAQARDKAIAESKTFVLLMTPGFNLSPEVIKELNIARKYADKQFIFFRHRNLGRKFVIELDDEVLDFGKQEQVSFETKEELLRLAHDALLKRNTPKDKPIKDTKSDSDSEIDIVKKFGLSS